MIIAIITLFVLQFGCAILFCILLRRNTRDLTAVARALRKHVESFQNLYSKLIQTVESNDLTLLNLIQENLQLQIMQPIVPEEPESEVDRVCTLLPLKDILPPL